MKFVKGICLFFVYPMLMLGIGIYAGVELSHFFYPGRGEAGITADPAPDPVSDPFSGTEEQVREDPLQELRAALEEDSLQEGDDNAPEDAETGDAAEEVLFMPETLCVDTEYVLEETDVLYHTVVETKWRLPDKYVGMNREEFLDAMELYEAFPPLSELERGFVGLEVLSFSRERVVIRMNYKFVQPSASFYLAVYDNEVVVYLEDMETVYIETDIRLDSLPEDIQQKIIDMMWIKDEEALYGFLENYSS